MVENVGGSPSGVITLVANISERLLIARCKILSGVLLV